MTTNRSLIDRVMQLGTPRLVPGFAPPPVPIAPDLWSIVRRLRMPGGPSLPTRSTLLRLASGRLLVVSPPAVEAGGLELLDVLGSVEEVLVPNSFHYLHTRGFLERYPEAVLWLAPGLPQRVAALPPGEELGAAEPASWGSVVEHQTLGPVRGISEVALFHRPSATLVLTDAAFHMVHYESGFERLIWKLFGVPAAFGPSRSARMLLLRDRAATAAFLARVLAWPFERVLVAHGEPLEENAVAAFRRAFAAYLGGSGAT